jgi:hypothetical protein
MQVEDLDGNVLRIGSDPEKEKPLGVWRDATGFVSDIWAIKGMSASTED